MMTSLSRRTGTARSAPPVRKAARRTVLAVLATLALALPAAAQGPKVYKVVHPFPGGHYLWTQGGQVFASEVEKASGGKIKFEVYPANQLGKDSISLLNSGLADIAIMPPSFAPEKLPLTSVSELPGFYSSACEGTSKLWALAKPGAPLDEMEYKSLGIHVLFVTVLPPYSLMSTSKPTPTLESLKGLKIRANGAAMDKMIRALGATPVRIASPELYDALSRGTVDAALFPYQGLPPYNLEKVIKHSVSGPKLGAGSVIYAMTAKAWDALPADTRDVFAKASASAQAALCKWQDEDDAKVREKIVAQDGHTITRLSPAETAAWNERADTVSTSWAKEFDALGKKGTELVRAFKEAPGK